MEYIVDGRKFSLSYTQLRTLYLDALSMTDEAFISDLPNLLHLACAIAYLKEIPASQCISDRGIIHQLVHLLAISDPVIDLSEIRRQFTIDLCLA